MFGNRSFLELGTRGSKIGKHRLERLRSSSALNGKPVVPRLGRIGSNGWEPAVSFAIAATNSHIKNRF